MRVSRLLFNQEGRFVSKAALAETTTEITWDQVAPVLESAGITGEFYTFEEIAAKVGATRQTIARWAKEDEWAREKLHFLEKIFQSV